MQIVIEFEEPQHYPQNPEQFPRITHCRIVNVAIEISRPLQHVEGHVDFWLARGFVAEEPRCFFEAPGLEGLHLVVADSELGAFQSMEFGDDQGLTELMKQLSQWLIDQRYIDGIVVEIEEPIGPAVP